MKLAGSVELNRLKVINAGFGTVKNDKELVLTLLILCRDLFGYGPTSCENELYRYFNKLLNYKNKAMTSKTDENRLYNLKKGRLLFRAGSHFRTDVPKDHPYYVSDSACKKMIKESPGLANNFETIPDAAAEKAAKEKAAEAAAAKKALKEEQEEKAADKLQENNEDQEAEQAIIKEDVEYYRGELTKLGIKFTHNAGLENLKNKFEEAIKDN